jgi:hypothetical protein
MPVRLKLYAQGTAKPKEPERNRKKSAKYPKVQWAIGKYPTCAVVGGGMSVQSRLETLRRWKGDIFAINDTAGYLSDHEIPCYLYAVDTTDIPYRIGSFVKGAVLASRVNIVQFRQMKKKPVWLFDMAEEDPHDGIGGGPTAVCRTAHLFLKMGYWGVQYFGIDGSFDMRLTHASGYSQAAYGNMMIVTAGGVDYLTNAAFMLQNEYMLEVLTDYKPFLSHDSDGLIKSMLENPDTWTVTAVADDLKNTYEGNGCMVWKNKYTDYNKEENAWQPMQATS